MSQRPLAFALGFAGGLIVGAVAALMVGYRALFPSTTVVYKATQPIPLANGAVLPVGTELIHDQEMAEGFTVLRLYVNVGAPESAYFSTRIEPAQNLVIPYWVAPVKQ